MQAAFTAFMRSKSRQFLENNEKSPSELLVIHNPDSKKFVGSTSEDLHDALRRKILDNTLSHQ